MIELLLRHRANPNIKDLKSNNCLHYILTQNSTIKKD
jgi:hypothetical protein